MFELPEVVTLTKQINSVLVGKTIEKGNLGNSPHKFVWYNRKPKEFEALTKGKTIGKAYSKGRWLFLPIEPGYTLVIGECGGKVLYHTPDSSPPKKYHLYLSFEDKSSLSVTTKMWGAMELYEKGQELDRQYIRDMKPTPIEGEFTLEYFSKLIDDLKKGEKRSAKSLLTQDQIIPGLGNAIAQDILFKAKLHPKQAIEDMNSIQIGQLYDAIKKTVTDVIDKGGRYDEWNLYNRPGEYVRIMDKNSVQKPCPECGEKIEKIQYLGGSCYFCPGCQT